MFKKIICFFNGHDWKNKNKHPVHGYYDTPHADSYCARCGKKGE